MPDPFVTGAAAIMMFIWPGHDIPPQPYVSAAACERGLDQLRHAGHGLFETVPGMAAAMAFFQSAKSVTAVTPDRVTTDGHDSYPRAIRTTLGDAVKHRTSRYLNNRLEQDHSGIKGRYQPMRGFESPRSAEQFCRGYDELRHLLHFRSRPHQHVSANNRRLHFLRRTATVMAILQAA